MIKLPEVGKVYAFYDDGKLGESRQYLAMVTRILSIDSIEVNKKIFGIDICEDDYIVRETERKYQFLHSIKEYWEYNVKQLQWLLAEETDYIIECAIP